MIWLSQSNGLREKCSEHLCVLQHIKWWDHSFIPDGIALQSIEFTTLFHKGVHRYALSPPPTHRIREPAAAWQHALAQIAELTEIEKRNQLDFWRDSSQHVSLHPWSDITEWQDTPIVWWIKPAKQLHSVPKQQAHTPRTSVLYSPYNNHHRADADARSSWDLWQMTSGTNQHHVYAETWMQVDFNQ